MRLTPGRPVATNFILIFSSIFLLIFFWLIRYCHRVSFDDPTSLFFDPARGYQRHYSLRRQHEAEEFLGHVDPSTKPHGGLKPPRMCIGIPSIAREGESYIGTTVGSLLAGLNATQRAELHIVVLIAHALPSKHPVFQEAWLEDTVDDVLTYDVSQPVLSNLTRWEKDRDFGFKGLFDYVYTLQHCANTGAQWVTMLEDDTIAVEGWYSRTLEALSYVVDQYKDSQDSDWLYLRLFFTEEFLGWNIENLPTYIMVSSATMTMVGVSLLFIRRFAFIRHLTDSYIIIAIFIYVPASILLYFAAGRLTVQPLNPGVHQMPRYGCCAQGLVYSSTTALRVANYLTQKKEGFVDEFLEEWANNEGMVRWVIFPSLLQHNGAHSSKGDDFGSNAERGRSVAERIWSFGFEKYDISRR